MRHAGLHGGPSSNRPEFPRSWQWGGRHFRKLDARQRQRRDNQGGGSVVLSQYPIIGFKWPCVTCLCAVAVRHRDPRPSNGNSSRSSEETQAIRGPEATRWVHVSPYATRDPAGVSITPSNTRSPWQKPRAIFLARTHPSVFPSAMLNDVGTPVAIIS